MRLILASVLLLALSACSLERDSPRAEPSRQPSPTAPDSPSPPAVPEQPDASDTPACAEVRAGIDDFNESDYEGTVDHFRTALPLARTQARATPSRGADDLVEAVTYYAELAPEAYPQSAISSPDFAKYKAITLGQCRPVGQPSRDDSSGPQVTT